jgi:hypothetical protein
MSVLLNTALISTCHRQHDLLSNAEAVSNYVYSLNVLDVKLPACPTSLGAAPYYQQRAHHTTTEQHSTGRIVDA